MGAVLGWKSSALPLLSKPMASLAPSCLSIFAQVGMVMPVPSAAPAMISQPWPVVERTSAGRQQPPPHVHYQSSTEAGLLDTATPLVTSWGLPPITSPTLPQPWEIGRASCRERV